MNGAPNFDYLAMVNQQLAGPAPGGPPQTIMLGGNGAPPAPPVMPAPPPPVAMGPQMSVAPPPPPNASELNMSVGQPAPPGPPSGAAPPAGPPMGPAMAPPPQGLIVGPGGMTRAREIDLRGPTFKAAESASNAATEQAIGAVRQRNDQTAAVEAEMTRGQYQAAAAREDAANASAAQRQEELAQRQADFDQSVKALGKMSLEPDRFWASRNTGQKLAAYVSIALGGFLQGAGKTQGNIGLDIINQQVDRDIKAQEFSYNAMRESASAKQTAFGMAMQKYNNVDAARAMARAAALDGVQAQIAQQAAMWKGTNAANHADEAMAQLEAMKAQQIQQGIRFLPATPTGPQLRTPEGIPLTPAQGLAWTEARRKEGHEVNLQDKRGEGELANTYLGKTLENITKREEHQAKAGENVVVLPNGDAVHAPTPVEAKELRDLSGTASNINRLVSRAEQIQSDPLWRAKPEARAEMSSLQSRLTTSYAVAAKLGALSASDMNLAVGATGDLFSLKPGTIQALKAYGGAANAAVRDRVATYQGAPDAAKGKPPASFKPTGTEGR